MDAAIPPLAIDDFRQALSRLGAAVNIITTDGAAGRHGMTASAVCSVTDSPPTILVCMNRKSGKHQLFRDNGVLCVNVLSARHRELSGRFATPAGAETRFDHDPWTRLATGAPVLAEASAALDCRITQITEVGSHSVFFCQVQGVATSPQAGGLVYFNRNYHGLGEPA
ncbi:MAG: flavin reductase [Pseudoxanthomonas sp.]